MKLSRFRTLAVGIAALVGLGLVALCARSCFTGHDDVPEVVAPAPLEPVPAPLASAPADQAPPATPGVAPGPAPADAAIPADPARPWDAVVLGWKGKPLGSEKLKDVTRGQSYKVNLYQDAGATVVDRAKVDIDRDDKWDEKWSFTGDAVQREVAPADDEVYTETWTWSGSGWTRK
jgi:hypothetical protein